MWMKSRPSQPVRDYDLLIFRLARSATVFFLKMPASSVDILLKDINVAVDRERVLFPVLCFAISFRFNGLKMRTKWLASHSFSRYIVWIERFHIFDDNRDSSIVAEGQSTRWELRVGSWESKEKESRNFWAFDTS